MAYLLPMHHVPRWNTLGSVLSIVRTLLAEEKARACFGWLHAKTITFLIISQAFPVKIVIIKFIYTIPGKLSCQVWGASSEAFKFAVNVTRTEILIRASEVETMTVRSKRFWTEGAESTSLANKIWNCKYNKTLDSGIYIIFYIYFWEFPGVGINQANDVVVGVSYEQFTSCVLRANSAWLLELYNKGIEWIFDMELLVIFIHF